MKLKRLFTTDGVKCTEGYLQSQKKYEIIRTAIYFAISLSLFIAGLVATKTRNNLLTIVAVLGCLPASKSLVEAVMYCRYKSLSTQAAELIKKHSEGLSCLYDAVFTTREKTYAVGHIAVRGNTVAAFTEQAKFSEADCMKHLETCLKFDRYTDVTIKIFKDAGKYAERLKQLRELPEDEKLTAGILNTLKSIAL